MPVNATFLVLFAFLGVFMSITGFVFIRTVALQRARNPAKARGTVVFSLITIIGFILSVLSLIFQDTSTVVLTGLTAFLIAAGVILFLLVEAVRWGLVAVRRWYHHRDTATGDASEI